jgi:ABC-type polysaccharide/polyol phosphate export permease
MSASRIIVAAAIVMMKALFRARVVIIVAVMQPVVFTAIVSLLLRMGHREPTLGQAVGTAVMGMWSSVLFFAGGMLTRERRQRTLEMLVAAPAPLLLTVLGASLATALIGLYALVTSVAVAVLWFGVPLEIAHPAAFGVASLSAIAGLGLFGVLLAALFVLFRQAGIFQNMLEYPVWIASGVMVPLAQLPGPVRAIGRLLPPTWGQEALRRAATGSGDAWSASLACAGLGLVYLVLGGALLVLAEHRARVRATLPLS